MDAKPGELVDLAPVATLGKVRRYVFFAEKKGVARFVGRQFTPVPKRPLSTKPIEIGALRADGKPGRTVTVPQPGKESAEFVFKAPRRVARGGEYVSPEIRQQLALNPPIPKLSPRQREILESMIRGLTDRDIAKQLGIRQYSVNDHVSSIIQKLGAANRTEAVAVALRKHLLKI